MYYVYDQMSIPDKEDPYEFYELDEIKKNAKLKAFETEEELNQFLEENGEDCWWPVHSLDSYSWVPFNCYTEEDAYECIQDSLNLSIYECINDI